MTAPKSPLYSSSDRRSATQVTSDFRRFKLSASVFAREEIIRTIQAGGQNRPPAGPGTWTSDFVVDLGPGLSKGVIEFVAFTYENMLHLLRDSTRLLHAVLRLLEANQGGPIAAARPQQWHAKGGGSCSHEVVEDSDRLRGEPDKYGFIPNIYFCSAFGERVDDVTGRRSPDGGTYL